MADGMTAYEKRYGQTFDGPSSPFGTLVEFFPITAKDKSRVHQFGKKTLNDIFLGYVSRAEGGCSGDLMMAYYEDFCKNQKSQKFTSKGSKAKKYS